MFFSQYAMPLLGGVLIGISASLLLLFVGRIFGVSGILAGVLLPRSGETSWRVAVLGGLLTAGLLLWQFYPEVLDAPTASPLWRYILAGLLVGFGTQLGSGCTSGHGVCGISRLSPRSMVATLTFVVTGVVVATLFAGAFT